MAGTLCSLLVTVFVAVVCIVWVTPVKGEGGLCMFMEDCTRAFKDEARRIGHDQGTYCRLKKKELDCFRSVFPSCFPIQRPFAQKQIETAQKEQLRACDATWPLSSLLLLSVATILAVFHNTRF